MKVEKYKPGVFIADVPNWHALGKVRVLVFNQFKLEVHGITGPGDTYKVYTDSRMTIARLDAVRNYINGVLDTLRSL